VPEGRLSDPLSGRAEITDLMRAAGFVFVALDLDGLRSGGMNSLLQLGPTRRALGFATLDLDRQERQGLPEVVYGPGKLPEEIKAIVLARALRGPGAGDARRPGHRRRRGRSRC
jgi:hypothetical protein